MTATQIKHTLIKRLLMILSAAIVLGVIYYSYQFHANNKKENWPGNNQIQQAFYNSVEWLNSNYSTAESTDNPVSWWMIKNAADISGNESLKNIFQKYKKRHLDPNPTNFWTPLYRSDYKALLPQPSALTGYAPDKIFLMYALSCNTPLARTSIIQKQLKPGFCSLHYIEPNCISQQLLSIQLMQKHSCSNEVNLDSLSKSLQVKLVNELTYDFRLTGPYIQRVLMLAWTGNFNAIKPVWIQRILAAQNSDGGWNDVQPMLTLSNIKSFGWTSTWPRYASTRSEFHETARGIWLMALLLQHIQPESAPSDKDKGDQPLSLSNK